MSLTRRHALTAWLCAVMFLSLHAQQSRTPSARLVAAPRLTLPAPVDSNIPMTWDRVDGTLRLFALASWGGRPAVMSGTDVDHLEGNDPVTFVTHPGYG